MEKCSGGKSLLDNCPGGNFMKHNFTGGGGGGVIVRETNTWGVVALRGNFIGDDCPEGSYPVAIISG